MILGPHILSKVPLTFLPLQGDDDDSNDHGDEDRDKEDAKSGNLYAICLKPNASAAIWRGNELNDVV